MFWGTIQSGVRKLFVRSSNKLKVPFFRKFWKITQKNFTFRTLFFSKILLLCKNHRFSAISSKSGQSRSQCKGSIYGQTQFDNYENSQLFGKIWRKNRRKFDSCVVRNLLKNNKHCLLHDENLNT